MPGQGTSRHPTQVAPTPPPPLLLQRFDACRQLPQLSLHAAPADALAGGTHREARDDVQLVLMLVQPVTDGGDVRLDGRDVAAHGEDGLPQQIEGELFRDRRQRALSSASSRLSVALMRASSVSRRSWVRSSATST